MANYNTLKSAIQAVIKQNGNNEITGNLLQQSLLSMINSLGAGFQFMGVATPSTNPGTPDQNVFYIAGTAGTYTNFGGLVVEKEAAILKYNGSWAREYTGIKIVSVSQNTSTGNTDITIGDTTTPLASPQKNDIVLQYNRTINSGSNYSIMSINVKKGDDIIIDFVNSTTNLSGIKVDLYYSGNIIETLTNLTGTHIVITNKNTLVDRIRITNNNTSAISINVFNRIYDSFEVISTVSDSSKINSIIKELYISKTAYNALSLNTNCRLRISYGAQFGGSYRVGFMINRNQYFKTYSSLSDITDDDLSVFYLNENIVAVVDWSKIELGTVTDEIWCQLFEYITDLKFSPSCDAYIYKLNYDNRPISGSNNAVKSGGVYDALQLKKSYLSNDIEFNSIVKELYLSQDLYNTIGNSTTISLWYGGLSGGKYWVGIGFSGMLISSTATPFDSLSDIQNYDFSKGIGYLDALVLADWSLIELGTVKTFSTGLILSEDVTDIINSPTLNLTRQSYYLELINKNSGILNISTLYPTGGYSNTKYYTLETAVQKLDANSARVGVIISFEVKPADVVYGSHSKTFVLSGTEVGDADVWYHNLSNYREIDNVENIVDITALYPSGGDNSDGRYRIEQAIELVPSEIRRLEQVIRFVNVMGNYETWQFMSRDISDYGRYIDYSWQRVDLPFRFLASCENKLANPLYETREHYNAEHPNNPINVTTVHPLNNSDNIRRRIPVCAITNAGTYLSAAQYQDEVLGDYGAFSIELSRKTTNGEWSSSIIVPFDSATNTWYGEASFLVERNNLQGHQGRIYLFFCAFTGISIWWEQTYQTTDFFYIYSDDDGVTWSNKISLKSFMNTNQYEFCIPAPNNGIQLTNGFFVVPCFAKLKNERKSRSLMLYKSLGENAWLFSPLVPTFYDEMDECAVVEYGTNVIALMAFNNGHGTLRSPTYLPLYTFEFNNRTWHELRSTFHPNRSCQGSLDRMTINDTVVYLMTEVDSQKNSVRKNITVWASLDLYRWIRVYRILKEQGNGYSSINNYDGNMIVVYERTQTIEFQDLQPVISMVTNSLPYLDESIGVQDRMQMLFNKLAGLD